MNAATTSLVGKKVFPAISIILPVHPQYPDIKTDNQHMKSILADVEKQLISKYGKEMREHMMTKVKQVISEIPMHHLSKSLLIYVSPEKETVISLPYTVTEKIIVDNSFEVRDLLYLLQKDKHYLAVIISQNQVKTFIGQISGLFEVAFPGMPDNVKDVLNEHSFPGWDYLDHKAFEEKNIRNYLRFIDDVLEKENKLTAFPVVVMGDVKLLGYFRQHTRNGKRIAGYVEGNYEHANAKVIREKAKKIVDAMNDEEEKDALFQLKEAVNKDFYAAGISEVWRAASEGRGRILLVEKDYHIAARHGSELSEITPDDSDINSHNRMMDAVDDVIELILKNNGEVKFLNNNALSDFNHIAVITRY